MDLSDIRDIQGSLQMMILPVGSSEAERVCDLAKEIASRCRPIEAIRGCTTRYANTRLLGFFLESPELSAVCKRPFELLYDAGQLAFVSAIEPPRLSATHTG